MSAKSSLTCAKPVATTSSNAAQELKIAGLEHMADTVVKFGTDGWRGIIADDFTYENVRVAGRAIAHYVLEHEDATAGVCVGYDTRFGSRPFAGVMAEVLSKAGIPVSLASKFTPT